MTAGSITMLLSFFSRFSACCSSLVNSLQRLTLESWYTNLEQTPLNRCQQLPAAYKRLIHDGNETDKRTSNQKPTNLTNYRRIETDQ